MLTKSDARRTKRRKRGSNVAQSLLRGPASLTREGIEQVLGKKRGGVYALGYLDPRGVFRIERVGRHEDLRQHLLNFIGSSSSFKYLQSLTAKEAFEIECQLFHSFRPRGNIMHPDRPTGSGWTCRYCLHYRE